MFLSTVTNKVDKKGRVSVPAGFRAAVAEQSFPGVVLFSSHHYPCLEGFGWSYVEELAQRLDNFDLFSNAQDDLATTIFGESIQLPFDGDGRIILPQALIEFAGLEEQASFVGMGRKFQIWNPKTFEARRNDARKNIREQGLTLPKGGRE